MQSIIDLLIPGQTPGIKEKLVDLYGKPELLFFGPDGASTFPPLLCCRG
jgi:glutamate dehydrogenase